MKLLARVGNIFVVLVKFCCVSRNQRKKRNVLVVVHVVVAVVVVVSVVVSVVFGFWVNVNVNVMRPARLVWSVWPVSCRHHLLYDLMYVCLLRTLEAFQEGHKVAETPLCPLSTFAAPFYSSSSSIKLQPAPQ